MNAILIKDLIMLCIGIAVGIYGLCLVLPEISRRESNIKVAYVMFIIWDSLIIGLMIGKLIHVLFSIFET